MLVNPKKPIVLVMSGLLLVSCSFVETPPTPKEWGYGAGQYASEEWIKKNGTNKYPSAEGMAMFCVNISEDGQKNYDWTVAEAYDSTMACTEAFAKGLGLKD